METPPLPSLPIQPCPEEPSVTASPELHIASSMSITFDGAKKKQVALNPRSKSSCSTGSSSQSSCRKRGIRLFRSRRDRKVLAGPGPSRQGDVGSLALPLGMSIAAIVAQVLKRKGASDKSMSMDHLSQVDSCCFISASGLQTGVQDFHIMCGPARVRQMDDLIKICAGAVRESLLNVYGDRFDGFIANFEKSFRSTLMTLHLLDQFAKDSGGEKENPEIGKCFSEVATASSTNRLEDSASDSGMKECWSDPLLTNSNNGQSRHHEEIEENMAMNFRDNQLILHDTEIARRVVSVIPSKNSNEFNHQSILSTLEKSVTEQVRSNDLKTFEMGLTMKKLELKERQLALSENANLMERWKLSFGFSKASFKVEKFKTQLEETRYAELLRKCIDCLVAGLFVMLSCVGYAVFIYSHQRISEATMSCSPKEEESKSWWLPKPMASFNSGWQTLKCHSQVWIRMFAGGFMIITIAYLLLQRSSGSTQAMPVTFIGLLLAVGCGFVGSLCIDTLGGNGSCWLFFWEILCCLHLFANIWTSLLYRILHGSLKVSEGMKTGPIVPYWMRRCVFFSTVCFFLPLLCGFLPFASLGDWKDHFFSLIPENSQL